ncbi:branched-chain amino acid ABC transporter permease [Paracoccus onubensis]|uniref:branched-chain amino acid ABC transporter permease n=1 Tax=Paracoccus onubensis TaxID=1675788 RepID=UPI002730C9C3|nr:branched-chain amino acid ABC transporter permease [Paracoccus onubensis]MDP0926799.1 branched-chain amino acid ABC transporter permease [Paracoccus onubensis]
MLYREAGDFKTSYRDDGQTFPIRLDRVAYYAVVIVAFMIVPFVINDYWANAVVVPFLIYAIAALGLNILTGYAGQVSLGTGGFMAVGAYAVYKLMTTFPEINIVIHILLAGGITAIVGMLFGLPSLRIKGFYLAVATLAAQFFLVWLFNKVPWFYNYSASGQITAPTRTVFGLAVTGPSTSAAAKYLICLVFVFILAWVARNLTRGTLGRKWMAIRDMDIAAEIIGVNPLTAKLSAFAVSSFFVGVSGALLFSVYLGAAEVGEAFGINKSFLVLFMIIIGGLGSIFGSFAGAAFMVLMPVVLKNLLVGQFGWATDLAAHFELMIVGALIVFFLIAEPHGLARLWALTKEKLRLWPFPH